MHTSPQHKIVLNGAVRVYNLASGSEAEGFEVIANQHANL